MHIPKGTTDQLELVTFQDALEAANTPSSDYDIQKWLSKTLHMQMTAIYCLGSKYKSLNLAFMIALIKEYIPEEKLHVCLEYMAAYFSKQSHITVHLNDVEIFASYYGLLLDYSGFILKEQGVGDKIDLLILENFHF